MDDILLSDYIPLVGDRLAAQAFARAHCDPHTTTRAAKKRKLLDDLISKVQAKRRSLMNEETNDVGNEQKIEEKAINLLKNQNVPSSWAGLTMTQRKSVTPTCEQLQEVVQIR